MWGQIITAIAGVAVASSLYAYRKLFRIKGKVPALSDERHGGQIVAQVLKAHGVKFLFTLCGGHISPILIGCKQLGIRVIDTRHEATAVFAADGVRTLSLVRR